MSYRHHPSVVGALAAVPAPDATSRPGAAPDATVSDLDSYRRPLCGVTRKLAILAAPVSCQLTAGHDPADVHHTCMESGDDDEGAWFLAVSWRDRRGDQEPEHGTSEPLSAAQGGNP